MPKHVLLSNSIKFKMNNVDTSMPGFYYDINKGYWLSVDETTPYIMDSRSIKPSSKKCDVETGEDMKGE